MLLIIGTLLLTSMVNVGMGTILNVTGGMYQNNKYMEAHVILAFNFYGPKMCVKDCLLYTDCNAVNFDKDKSICQLLTISYPGDTLTDISGSYFTEKGNWSKDNDACWPNTCPGGTKCIVLYGNEQFCHIYDTPCDTHECKNGGQCVNVVEGYECRCPDGYYGTYCQFTPCTAEPCIHGGCSINGATYVCHCVSGYYGKNCQYDPCTNKPCQNGGNCKVSGSTYACSCVPGYSGKSCQVGPCSNKPCQNGGNCKVSGSTYACTCVTGYNGNNCEVCYDVNGNCGEPDVQCDNNCRKTCGLC